MSSEIFSFAWSSLLIKFILYIHMCVYMCIYIFFYCILGFGVHVNNMQDCCISTYMAMWFAIFLPVTYIWHYSPSYPSPAPQPPTFLPLATTNRPQCVMIPSLCPCVLIVHHPSMSKNMWCLIFCSCVFAENDGFCGDISLIFFIASV